MRMALITAAFVASLAAAITPEAMITPAAAVTPAASVAHVSRPGKPAPDPWTQVTPSGTPVINDVGLVRGHDGILHVLWLKGESSPVSIVDTPIGPGGTVHHAVTVVSDWFDSNIPDATATPNGLYVLWNGEPKDSPESVAGVYEATRPLSGGSWSRASVAANTGDIADSEVPEAAATGPNGKPWAAFAQTGQLDIVPIGDPPVQIPPTQCCVSEVGLGEDGVTGTMWVGYLSLVSGHEGIYAQRLTANGHASGAALRLPGSQARGAVVVAPQRIAITGRGDGHAGVYVAYGSGYPTYTAVDVTRAGSSTATVLARAADINQVTMAADPGGRLWVAWTEYGSGAPRLFISRSGTSGGGFSKPEIVALPAGTHLVWKLYLNAQTSNADVLALVSRSDGSPAAYWSRIVAPPK
jgi:hypothetical protein